jgi:hypothetical protein
MEDRNDYVEKTTMQEDAEIHHETECTEVWYLMLNRHTNISVRAGTHTYMYT